MTDRLGDAVLELRTDDSAYLRGVDQAQRRAQNLDRGLQRTSRAATSLGGRLQALGGRLQRLSRQFLSLRSAAVAAAGATGLFFVANRAIQAADEIGKTARAVGLSAEALQEWRFAAGRAGVATSMLDRGMVRFSRTIGQAARGQETQLRLFRELGVRIFDASGRLRDQDAILRDTTVALSGLDSEARANAFAMELFGDRTGRMARFLAQGAEEIERLRRRARELGVVISNEIIERAEQAADELGDMQQAMSVTATSAALELMPAMRLLANTMTDPQFLASLRALTTSIAQLIVFFVRYSDVIIPVVAGLLAAGTAARLGARQYSALVGIVAGAGTAFLRMGGDAQTAEQAVRELRDVSALLLEEFDEVGSEGGGLDRMATFLERLAAATAEARLEGELLAGNYSEAEAAVRRFMEEAGFDDFLMGHGEDWERARQAIEEYTAAVEQLRIWRDVARIIEETKTEQEKLNEQLERLEELRPYLTIEQYERALEELNRRLEEAEEETDHLAEAVDDLGERITRAFSDGKLSAENLLRLLPDILDWLIKIASVEGGGGGGGLGSFISGLFSAKGNAFAGGDVVPMARGGAGSGGILRMPTAFPMRSGGLAIGGELADEAILPLRRMPSGDLGVAASGGGGGGVSNVFNIDARGAQRGVGEEIRREMLKLMPEIERRSVAAVGRSRTRGGLREF